MTTPRRLLALLVITLAAASCDGHSWKETQVLHEKYNAHGTHDAAPAHVAPKDAHPAPAASHEAKPTAHPAPPAAHSADKPKP